MLAPGSQAFQDLGLDRPHFRFLILFSMIVAQQMQHTMNDQQLQLILNWMTARSCLSLSAR